MSYDTKILRPACAHCGRADECVTIGNTTSNVGPMFRAVLPGPYEGGGRYDGLGDPKPQGGLVGLSGLPVATALPLLRQAILDMEARREELLPMEPSNGWGSFSGALGYLCDIANACEAAPDGVVAVNW